APVGDGTARRPDLLAVDDVMIAGVLGARLQTREIGPRVRLRVQLAPDLFGRQHLLEVALLLRLGAVHDDRGPDEPDAEAVDRGRRADAGILVLQDGLLHRRRAPAAVLLGPQHADVTRLVELAVPGLALRERLEVFPGRVGLEPAAGLLAKRAVLGRIV